MNEDLLSHNLLNSSDISDIRRFSSLVDQYNLKDESIVVDYQSLGELEHADTWKYPHFQYNIHKYGYRIDNIPSEVDIAAFGCSFTFGQGLPSEMLWHSKLAQSLGMSSINFGIPGSSIETSVDLFLIASQHIKIKHAIFLLPVHTRKQIATVNKNSGEIRYLPIMSNLFNSQLAKYYELDVEAIYKYMPDEEFLKVSKNQLFLAELIGKLRGVNVYFSAWDPDTYQMLTKLNFTSSKLLPSWHSRNSSQLKNDLARDNAHPGPEHHNDWATNIKEYIK